jgi:RhtB (resistance to homoserine/threonine) family protein
MIDQLLVIVGITFLALVSPGPDMILVVRNTLLAGRRAGLQTSLGILAGNLVHITYCVIGIGWIISQSILAFTVLKYAGAAYLIYLGITSFRSGARHLDTNSIKESPRSRIWFVQGFFNNLLNPKGTLFFLGVFTMVITPETSASATLVLVLTMMLMCALFWLFFVYTLDRSVVREVIERSQQIANRIFGAALVLLGMRVATMER